MRSAFLHDRDLYRVIQGLYWVYIGLHGGLFRGYRDNGKEHGSYYVGFRAYIGDGRQVSAVSYFGHAFQHVRIFLALQVLLVFCAGIKPFCLG